MVAAKNSSAQITQRYRPSAVAAGASAHVALHPSTSTSVSSARALHERASRGPVSDGWVAPMDRELAMAEPLGGRELAGARPRAISSSSRSAAASIDLRVSRMPLTSRSVLSAIVCAVRALPVILITGAIGFPVGVPEPGRKHHDLRAAADHAGDRLDVEARRVHDRQALARDAAGIGHDVFERRALAGLVRRAQRLLLDRRQAAADVAGRRLRAADVEAERLRFALDAVDDPQQPRRRRPVAWPARRADVRRP